MNQLVQAIKAELERHNTFDNAHSESNDFDRAELRSQVTEELRHHLEGHSHSAILVDQLVDIYGQGFVSIAGQKHPYDPHEIYIAIEQVISNKAAIKPFRSKRSALYGRDIYHSHHSQNFYIKMNCIRCFGTRYQTDLQIMERLSSIKKSNPMRDDIIAMLVHEVLVESLTWNKKTGEWLVYQRANDGFHFLCLYVHQSDSNDQILFDFIERHLL